MSDQVETVRNDDESRYEGRLAGRIVTTVDFVADGPVLTIIHTGTDPAYRGRGLAGTVTQAALEDVRRRGERVRPACGFAVTYLDAHQEFADLRV